MIDHHIILMYEYLLCVCARKQKFFFSVFLFFFQTYGRLERKWRNEHFHCIKSKEYFHIITIAYITIYRYTHTVSFILFYFAHLLAQQPVQSVSQLMWACVCLHTFKHDIIHTVVLQRYVYHIHTNRYLLYRRITQRMSILLLVFLYDCWCRRLFLLLSLCFVSRTFS